ncbi:MAG: hypothetical protein H3Z50_06660 [archaeon]|nr:hypothetical protein [archaeon]MCP8306693.1 hypothetical protein [archaeon]
MNPKLKTYLITGMILAGIVLGLYFYPKPSMFTESFEKGFGGWMIDSDVPLDPNTGDDVFWDVSRTDSVSYSGSYSLNLSIDGRQDEGTVWIERWILVKPSSNVQVKISFQLFSEFESWNDIAGVCAYVGTYDPEVEADFTPLGKANQVSDWKEYSYVKNLNTGSNDEIWVALGITVLWETHMSYNIDDIEIVMIS